MNKNKKRFESKRPLDIKEYKVHNEEELLTFLLRTLNNMSRNNVKNILKNHQVAVDGAPITQFDFMLAKDDVVIISKNRISSKKEREQLPLLYEDDELIVINKPSGVLSVASDKEKGRTAYRMVTEYVQEKDKRNRIYVVHRLDEDTSGVLMFAKNENIRDDLQHNWDKCVIKRGYYAITDGVVKEKERKLVNYLIPNKLNLMVVTHDKNNGKKCITSYKEIVSTDEYSLLDVKIETGRKNQIRVQLGNIGYFIIGDDKYGEPSNPIKRLGLHAYCLELNHPTTNKNLKFFAPMPKEFNNLMPSKKGKK